MIKLTQLEYDTLMEEERNRLLDIDFYERMGYFPTSEMLESVIPEEYEIVE